MGGRLAQHGHDVVLSPGAPTGRHRRRRPARPHRPTTRSGSALAWSAHVAELGLGRRRRRAAGGEGPGHRRGAGQPGRRAAPTCRSPASRTAWTTSARRSGARPASTPCPVMLPGHPPGARRGRRLVGTRHRHPRRRAATRPASTTSADAISAAFAASAFSSVANPAVMRFKWSKLLMNLGNALEAACGPIGRGSAAVPRRRGRRPRPCSRRPGVDVASDEEDAARRGDLISIRPDRRGAPRRRLVVAEPGPRHRVHRGRPPERRDRAARPPPRRPHAGERAAPARSPTTWPAARRPAGVAHARGAGPAAPARAL